MTTTRNRRISLAVLLIVTLIAGLVVALRSANELSRIHVVAYFDNSNGIYPGDEVRILGVPVGKIDSIQPQPDRVKVSFWFDDKYKVPADAKAVILSPTLVTARAIQLTPTYGSGPTIENNAVIPQQRTAVPVEWDDVGQQLQRLTQTLQPTEPGGVAPLNSFINVAADNVRGQGLNIRDSIIKLSQAASTLGDHSNDIFGTVRNLSVLVSALQSSTELTKSLNRNLAAVTALVANDPNEVGNAVNDLNTAVGDVQSFIAENREPLGTTFDKLASVTTALTDSLDDVKQALHVLPNTTANVVNVWRPSQGAFAGGTAFSQFANPISFICGAIQAASRLGAEQSAKLCVQYLAPIIKNRQYNFAPIGINQLAGVVARPSDITYSEDWMRPDYVPPQVQPPTDQPLSAEAQLRPGPAALSPTEPVVTDPAAGLPGMMLAPGGGS
jgi:phospholipid/cholesterol/gamma-HCH transport system substrate-binding protein